MAHASDARWEEFFDELQRLHVHKAVIVCFCSSLFVELHVLTDCQGLMSSHTIEDLTSCILDYQANVVRMTHRRKTCPVDPEHEPAHLEALTYIWTNSKLREDVHSNGTIMKWRKLGFDTEDITQEFHEVGVWGLDCFVSGAQLLFLGL